jgi:hypothetical protein
MSWQSETYIFLSPSATPPNTIEGVPIAITSVGIPVLATSPGANKVTPFGADENADLTLSQNGLFYPVSKAPASGLWLTNESDDGSTPVAVDASYSGQGELHTQEYLSTIGENIPQSGAPALTNASQQVIAGVAASALQVFNFYGGSVGSVGNKFS